MRRITVAGCILTATLLTAQAQSWDVPYRQTEIVLDGHLEEWEGVPRLVLAPGSAGISQQGSFGEGDLSVTLRAMWDEENLYVAVEWRDDRWDVREVRRRDSVFVTPDRRRRDRMLFFDNLRLQIHELEFDYLLWVSPRVEGQGPYFWHRRLLGARVRESATRDPVITPREHDDGSVTLEMLFEWKQLQLKPKKRKKKGLPLEVLVADSDQPGSILESKLDHLKHLSWRGSLRLGSR